MIEALIVQGDTGTRRFGIQDCPLVVGGSSRSHIRLAGLGSRDEPLLIGISEGRVFAQPGAGGERPLVSGDILDASRWLADGDEIEVGGSWLRFSLSEAGAVLKIAPETRDDDTLPPLILEPPSSRDDIAPVPFIASETDPRPQRRRSPRP